MVTTTNANQFSYFYLQTLKKQQINDIFFKPNYSSSLNIPSNSRFTQLKYKYQKPLVKPLLSCAENFLSKAELDHGPLLFGAGWTQIEVPSDRGDFRVWSRRRPGSKSKETRLIIDLECSVCCKSRYTTERHKDFARRRGDKEKLKFKQNQKIQSEREGEKEKRRLERQEERKKVNAQDVLLLFKFCPKCHKQTLHKEVKVKRHSK